MYILSRLIFRGQGRSFYINLIGFLVNLKTSKGLFENNWPLALQIRTASAICWNYSGLFRLRLKSYFLRNKSFVFQVPTDGVLLSQFSVTVLISSTCSSWRACYVLEKQKKYIYFITIFYSTYLSKYVDYGSVLYQ